jgi:hypothetical protein
MKTFFNPTHWHDFTGHHITSNGLPRIINVNELE